MCREIKMKGYDSYNREMIEGSDSEMISFSRNIECGSNVNLSLNQNEISKSVTNQFSVGIDSATEIVTSVVNCQW